MRNRKLQRRQRQSKGFKTLKTIFKYLSRHPTLAVWSFLCTAMVAGLLIVYHYGFLMVTEKDLHEKRTIGIGVNMKAASEITIIASSSSTVQEIFDKVAEINRLNRKLHEEPELSPEMLRPTSIKMNGINDVPLEIRAHELDDSLNSELRRLQMLTGDFGKTS